MDSIRPLLPLPPDGPASALLNKRSVRSYSPSRRRLHPQATPVSVTFPTPAIWVSPRCASTEVSPYMRPPTCTYAFKVVRTRPDADTRSCLAKAISVSVRCYEVRVGRVSVLQSNCLVDYTQVLWTKPDSAEFEQIGALDLPFRITLPTHIAGFSTALFVDYRCMWRVEAGA